MPFETSHGFIFRVLLGRTEAESNLSSVNLKLLLMKQNKFRSFEDLAEHVALWGLVSVDGRRPSEELLFIPGLVEIPISRRSGSEMTVARIRSSTKGQEVPKVLWDCLFGTPRTLHWFLLFEIVNRSTKYEPLLQLLFDVMMLINSNSPRGGSLESMLNMKEKSVRQVLGVQTADELAKTFRALGVSIPKKRPSLHLSVSIETKKFQTPPEIRRIGVGYKDKGSLPLPGSQYDPTEYDGLAYCPIKLWQTLLAKYHSNWPKPFQKH